MNPPLSYASPHQVEEIDIAMPVSGVSKGGDSTGGSVRITTLKPKFADTAGPEVNRYSGEAHAGYRSNGSVITLGGKTNIHNDWASLSYSGNWAQSKNYEDGKGEKVLSTEYEGQNHEVALGLKGDLGLTTLRANGQFIPYQAYVNQRMDMVYNKSWGASAAHEADTRWGKLDALTYFNYVRHEMNFLDDKKYSSVPPRDMPMDSEGKDFGYKISLNRSLADGGSIKIGNELHRQLLDEWWPPVIGKPGMCCDTYELIDGGERTRIGTFFEWNKRFSSEWSANLGVRNDIVWMNTGDVQGYNTNPMMGYAADAAAFNAQDHSKPDVNFDANAMLAFEPFSGVKFEGGYARKTRSPNFYERYAWSAANTMPGQMSKNMIGWFGDGNGYIGNLGLDPEIAHNFSVTASFNDPASDAWSLAVTPFYSYVQDYIGVRKVSDSLTPGGFVNLQFVNHDAELYGVDARGHLRLAQDTVIGDIGLTGMMSYVYGKNRDTGGALYHMMPFNGRVALEQKSEHWTNAVELQFVTAKDRVDNERLELETSGYLLLNVRSSWEHGNLRLDAGIDNVLDTYYELPLGGVEITPMLFGQPKDTVPGMGRSFYLSATLKF